MDSLIVITNGTVLTCDDANRAGRFNITIRNGRIIEISHPRETTPLPNATIVDAKGKLILPGFVNAHVHTESFVLRERTQFIPMALWKQDIRLHEAKQLLLHPSNRDDVHLLYLHTYFNHLQSGTTCVGEFLPEVDNKTLIRVLQAIETTGITPVLTLQTWDQLRLMRDLGSGRPRACIGLGREEDWTVHKFENFIRESLDSGIPILAHIAEQRDDVEPVRKNFLKEPIELLQNFRLLQTPSAIVHGNHVSNADCDILESLDTVIAVSPLSSSTKQSGYPALREFVERNFRLALGTDWGTCDMIEEMKFMYRLPLVVSGLRRFTPMEIVRMATINGARALNLASETGSLEVGKRADVTLLSLHRLGIPDTGGLDADGLSRVLLTHLTSSDVSDVMANGEFMVRDHALVAIDENDVRESFHEMLPKYFPTPKAIPQHQSAELRKARIFPFWQMRGSEIKDGLDGSRLADLETPVSSAVTIPESPKDGKNHPKTPNRVFGEDDLS